MRRSVLDEPPMANLGTATSHRFDDARRVGERVHRDGAPGDTGAKLSEGSSICVMAFRPHRAE